MRFVLLSLSFGRFCLVVVFMLLLELRKCSSDIFLSTRSHTGLATTYITGYGGGPIVNMKSTTTTTMHRKKTNSENAGM